MRRVAPVALMAALAGCAAPPPQTGVDPAIADELARAGERKPPARAETLDRALLPPMQMDMPEVSGLDDRAALRPVGEQCAGGAGLHVDRLRHALQHAPASGGGRHDLGQPQGRHGRGGALGDPRALRLRLPHGRHAHLRAARGAADARLPGQLPARPAPRHLRHPRQLGRGHRHGPDHDADARRPGADLDQLEPRARVEPRHDAAEQRFLGRPAHGAPRHRRHRRRALRSSSRPSPAWWWCARCRSSCARSSSTCALRACRSSARSCSRRRSSRWRSRTTTRPASTGPSSTATSRSASSPPTPTSRRSSARAARCSPPASRPAA